MPSPRRHRVVGKPKTYFLLEILSEKFGSVEFGLVCRSFLMHFNPVSFCIGARQHTGYRRQYPDVTMTSAINLTPCQYRLVAFIYKDNEVETRAAQTVKERLKIFFKRKKSKKKTRFNKLIYIRSKSFHAVKSVLI